MKLSIFYVSILFFIGSVGCQSASNTKNSDKSISQDSSNIKTNLADSSKTISKDTFQKNIPSSEAKIGNAKEPQPKDSLLHSSHKISENSGPDQEKLDSIKKAKMKTKK